MNITSRLIFIFVAGVFAAYLLPQAGGEITASLGVSELHAGIPTELNFTVTPDKDEELNISVFLGRENYGSLLYSLNVTGIAGENISFNLSFVPLFGENHIFLYAYNATEVHEYHFDLVADEDYSDVLLIINNNSEESREIGEYFLTKHNPYVFYLDAPVKETINNSEFQECKAQIEEFLQNNSLSDRINYIITTKGVPLRVNRGSGGYSSTNAAFDSELTLLLGTYSSSIGEAGYVSNPYYEQDKRFSRKNYGIYLVTRLTGYTVEDVKGIIDRALIASRVSGAKNLTNGQIILDVDPGKDGSAGYRVGNDWLRNAANTTTARGYAPYLDQTSSFVSYQRNVSLYASWGSNDGHDFFPHGVNTGMESDENGDQLPDSWVLLTEDGMINMTDEDCHAGRWSVRIIHNSTSCESQVLQNFTPEAEKRYYLRGYANLSQISGSGGVALTIRYYNETHGIIQTVKGVASKGTTSDWISLSSCILEPLNGTDYVGFGAVLYNATGTVYLDDIQLVEIVPHNHYLPGAISETFVSTSARSFHYPTNYGQSLIADMIHSGVTGVKGYCFEPYLDAIAHPDILFDRYTAGYHLAESYYAASIKLSWMDVVVGDPKLAPYGFLPDLKIDDMCITPSSANSMNISIILSVSNYGGTPSLPSNLTLSIFNTTAFWNWSLPVPLLYPAEKIRFDFQWSAQETGNYTALAILNHTGYEKEKKNNRLEREFDVLSPPDLAFMGHTITPSVPTEGENFTMVLDVVNLGESTAEKVNLSLFIDGEYFRSILLTVAGGVTRHPEFVFSTSPGFHTITAILDSKNTIYEGNESNNRLDLEVGVNAKPVALANNNIITRAGLPVVFNASESYDPDGNITFYSWHFLGEDWPGKVVTAYFYQRGNQTVILTVRDNDGAENSTTIVVTVENTPPHASAIFPSNVLSLEPVSFDARQSKDNDSMFLSYYWELGDGTTSTANYLTHAYTSPGCYTVLLRVTDDMGASDVISGVITVENRLPVISLIVEYQNSTFSSQTASSVFFTTGEPIMFNLTTTYDPDGYIENWTVDFGDGITEDFSAKHLTVSHIFSVPGNHSVRITVKDNWGGNAVISMVIHVVPKTLSVELFIDPIEPMTFESVHISGKAIGGYGVMNFTYSIDGIIYHGKEQNLSFETYGNHYITLIITDETGQSASQNFTLVVMDSPPVVENGTISCKVGEKVRLHWNVSDRDGGISYYLITFPDGIQLQTQSPVLFYTFHSPGTYVLNITAVDDMGMPGTGNLTVKVENSEDNGGLVSGFETMETIGVLGIVISVLWRKKGRDEKENHSTSSRK